MQTFHGRDRIDPGIVISQSVHEIPWGCNPTEREIGRMKMRAHTRAWV